MIPPCPLCEARHRPERSPCRVDPDGCRGRLDDPFAARHARCILPSGHRGPHWGPAHGAGGGRYVEWRDRTPIAVQHSQ